MLSPALNGQNQGEDNSFPCLSIVGRSFHAMPASGTLECENFCVRLNKIAERATSIAWGRFKKLAAIGQGGGGHFSTHSALGSPSTPRANYDAPLQNEKPQPLSATLASVYGQPRWLEDADRPAISLFRRLD